MRRGYINWRSLRLPMVVLMLVLMAGGGFVAWTAQRAMEAAQTLQAEETVRKEMRERVDRVDEERRTILQYAPRYRRLVEQGIAGGEQRVNWLDALRAANLTLRGFGVDYTVGSQSGAPFAIDVGHHELQQSTMKLRLRLLHEGDLLAFFEALAAQHAGLYLLQGCSLQRLSPDGTFVVRFEPKLAAECELVWLTLSADRRRERK